MVVAVDAVVIKCSLKATIADVTKMTTETRYRVTVNVL